jgi:Tfp pilus assembly protein PilV
VRKGFTLVEAIVALLLFEFGMLALAAASAVAARDIAYAQRSMRAQALARHRVELLRANACPAPGSGTAEAPGGLREFWRVDATGPLRIISDSVDLMLPGGRRGDVVLRAWTICAQ